jgi:hypothetical protein
MNGEPEYQPDFVVVKEPTEELQQEEASLKKSPIEDPITKAKTELLSREVDFVHKQRKKLRLFDPKGVYFYRHIPISYLHSFFHLVSLGVSCLIIYLLWQESINVNEEVVKGIGEVSNTTVLEWLFFIMSLIVIIRQLTVLYQLKGADINKRYKLSMLSNAVNRVVLNHTNIFIFLLLFIGVFSLTNDSFIELEFMYEKFKNGVFADIFDAAISLLSLIILIRAFRFCGKEVN